MVIIKLFSIRMSSVSYLAKSWLEDVLILLEKIKDYVELNKTELTHITSDPQLEPAHRSFYLYKVIKDREKTNEVSKLLYGIYCGHKCRDLHCKQLQGKRIIYAQESVTGW